MSGDELFSMANEWSFIVWVLKPKQSNKIINKYRTATNTPYMG